MVYRLGEQARFYKLRRVWRRRHVRLGTLGLLCLILVGLVMMNFAPKSIAHALGLGSKSTPASASKPHSSTPAHTTGSSTPPPKGILTTAAADASAYTALHSTDCNVFPPKHTGLARSASPELRKLAEYEQLCNGAVAARTSIFVPTPSTAAQAQASAQAVATELKAYSQAGIPPLVFMEPTDPNGHGLDLTQFANGAYDTALTTYFQALQSASITSTSMGMWVYLPEGNLPVWSTTDPDTYAAVVTKMAQLQKQYFPGSLASVMLDSQSYAPGASWGNGSYTSLMPYVQNIPHGLIDSFGLQGFPWAAPANQPQEGSLYDPKIYLRTDLAVQAARTLGINDIWFNTGTFAQMYAGQSGKSVVNTPVQRQQMLEQIVQLSQQVKAQGFTVAIHLFSQNKTNLTEGTDWSYWRTTPSDTSHTAVFTTFAHSATTAGIPLWLYDTQ